jgi:molybdate transport system ATP-binding protein
MPIIAEVTAAAIGALGLTEGSEVWAAVKATEVDVHPA